MLPWDGGHTGKDPAPAEAGAAGGRRGPVEEGLLLPRRVARSPAEFISAGSNNDNPNYIILVGNVVRMNHFY